MTSTHGHTDGLPLITRNLFFTGKGGVGKTSLACTMAVLLADAGQRVLLVSTDPASNLDEVLGTRLTNRPTPVSAAGGLFAMNLDPQQAAAEYRERVVGPFRSMLPASAIQSMEEQLSGSCTVEIAAFDQFAQLLADQQATADFDRVVFDTAPTGHTLRLLNLPAAWTGYLQSNTTGSSCLGPLAGLQSQQALYRDTLNALRDSELTTLVLVTRADVTTFREAARTSDELHALGVNNQHLLINAVFPPEVTSDPVAAEMQRQNAQAIQEMPQVLRSLPQTRVLLTGQTLLGIPALKSLARLLQSGPDRSVNPAASDASPACPDAGDPRADAFALESPDAKAGATAALPAGCEPLIDELAEQRQGLILVMGKGGVGKTTVAAAVAVALADRGIPVHLSTTDPAAHLQGVLAKTESLPLTVSRIDPAAEVQTYTRHVMDTAGATLDADGQALLAEDLRSPCTEEIAVFRAFAAVVAEAEDRVVVLDTAPTGHTILLLDAALAYHREVSRQTSQIPDAVQNLLPRLRDTTRTRILIVTLPEATPVHEAAQLQSDLRRAGMEPFAWIINQTLVPFRVTHPLLQARQANELEYLREVVQQHAQRVGLIAWQPRSPVGLQALRELLLQAGEDLQAPAPEPSRAG